MKYKFTRVSSNAKTGFIPVTMTEKSSCSPTCPFKANGCYAENFPLKLHWERVSDTGTDLPTLCKEIKKLPAGQLWRHNVAGDLDHTAGHINRKSLQTLTDANQGKRGFTYTHHRLETGANGEAIKAANDQGFIINASCDSPEDAAQVWDKFRVPCVTVVPANETRKTWMLETGHRVIRCPATYREESTCENCKLCAMPSRRAIIAFPAHGARKKAAERQLTKG